MEQININQINMNKKFINELNKLISSTSISTEIMESIISMDISKDIIDNCFAKFIGKLPSAQLGYEYLKIATNIPVLKDNEIERILFIGDIYRLHALQEHNELDKKNIHWYYCLEEKICEFKKKHKFN
jgi:hypothetical protein